MSRQAGVQLESIEAFADVFADALAHEFGYVIGEVLLTDPRSVAYALLERVEKDSRAVNLEWYLKEPSHKHGQ